MKTIRLPRIAGARRAATELIKDANVATGDEVTLDGRRMALNSESFAFQMAEDLSALQPKSVVVIGGSPDWIRDIHKAAEEYHLRLKDKSLTRA